MITVHVRLELSEQEPDREKIANLLKEIAEDIDQNTYERATWKSGEATLHYAIRPGPPPEDLNLMLS